MNAKILIVEDDPDIAKLLALTVRENGMTPFLAQNGQEMRIHMRKEQFDLIVLDVMLPGEDGLALCKTVRSESTTPIMLITALDEEIDRIVGLEVGADDYVTKPFSPREVIARIRSLLRRASYGLANTPVPRRLRFEGWSVDPIRRQLHDPANVRIALTATEFELLLAFCRNAGKVLTREDLLTLTHTGLVGPIERTVDVHISRLRQKIEVDPKAPAFIQTVRLGGVYLLCHR